MAVNEPDRCNNRYRGSRFQPRLFKQKQGESGTATTARRALAATLLMGVVLLCPPLAGGAREEKGAGLSPQVHKRLNSIHELIDQGRDDAALSALNTLLPQVGQRRYEKAVVLQNLAYVQTGRDRFNAAIKAFEESLALKALPETAQQQMRYNLAQLYLASAAPAKAVPILLEWFDQATDPAAEAYLLLGHAQAQLKHYRKAIPALQQAIERAETPHEDWYETLLAMHYELKSYPACASLLKQMIRLFPENDAYWQQLAGMYMTLNKPAPALTVLELAWRRGSMKSEQDLIQLVQLYLYQDIPFKAARLLEAEMNSGRIKRSVSNQELLANAWTLARERDAAIRAYQQVAAAGHNAEADFTLAQLYLEDERWDEAAAVLESALAKTGLRNPGNAWLLLGIAHYELNAPAAARGSFQKATRFEATRKTARQWLAHLERHS
ncbi:MAG: hypothetical protein U9P11_10535 [Pseudomonadota bacterium]|nr:hypothetical protein [Pseudomonadota bacterium]